MRRQLTLTALLWLGLVFIARGDSVEIPVTPKALDQGPFVFSVATKPAQDGIAFHITVTAKSGAIQPDSKFGLSLVHKTTDTLSIGPVTPEVPVILKKEKSVWTADFTISDATARNPEVHFIFSAYAHTTVDGKDVPMPSVDFYEIRLRDFLPQK